MPTNLNSTSSAPVVPDPSPFTAARGRPWLALLLGLTGLLAWDASGLDMWVAQWSGGPEGFAWRDHILLANVLHSGARWAGWAVLIGLTLSAARPWGLFKALSPRERTGLASSVWLALLAVTVLKGLSRTSCPWDLAAFGGAASHLSHWAWGQVDGGPGHCFPAGHASTGFAFVAGYFWLRPRHPLCARRWLWAALVSGCVLGLAQQLRGAHFTSHTLWTAWICWATGTVTWETGKIKIRSKLRF